MVDQHHFRLRSERPGALPLVRHFLARLDLAASLERYLPRHDARLRLAPAAVIELVVTNIAVSHRPLYALGEWAAAYPAAQLGLAPGDAAMLNDDRVGRMLDRLFDADRASLLTELVTAMIGEFELDCAQLHNDSTTVSFHGAYRTATGARRGGQPTPAIVHGFSKDHRPDLKQLLFILTVSADGAVPIAYRTADGNTVDDRTHITTWDALCRLLGRSGFLYVADSKLCSAEAMGHIAQGGGRFITVLPRRRREDRWFRDFAQRHRPDWAEAERRPGSRRDDPDEVWRTWVAPLPSAEGHRVVWVHSSAKAARDAEARQARVEAGLAAIDAVAQRLASPKSRLRTRVAVEAAADAALTAAGARRWVGCAVSEEQRETFRQERRGRPGGEARYRRLRRSVFHIEARTNAEAIAADAATDGCFALVSNADALAPAELLKHYRYQPHLERRHHMLKGPQEVAPVFLKQPHRIEAILLCHYLAMLTEALIERELRTSMQAAGLSGIPLYPELRNCPAPSASRILEIFDGIQRHQLLSDGAVVQVFDPELTPLQQQVLDLLHIPATVYASDGATC